MKNQEFKNYAERNCQELYELLLQLARIPAPLGGEERRAQFCKKWLEDHGAEGVYIDQAGNVVYPYLAGTAAVRELEGEAATADSGCLPDSKMLSGTGDVPLVVFAAHMDVVFPDETELPLTERDGKIYCPGVGDDTANLCVLLMMAAYAAKYQPDTGAYGILFVCDTGEEGLGNLKGVREICRVYGERMAVFYGLDLCLESYTSKAVGSLRYGVTVYTRGGHSYACFGSTSANAVLADLIHALYQVKVRTRGKTTYNVGMISGGTSVNTIAQKAELLYEIRSDEEKDLREMKQTFHKIVEQFQKNSPSDCRIEIELLGERPCESGVDEEKRQWLFRQAERVIREQAGITTIPVPCSTDCNIPLSLGIPSICIGTCQGAGAHTREEYIRKDSMKPGLQVALQILHEVKELF